MPNMTKTDTFKLLDEIHARTGLRPTQAEARNRFWRGETAVFQAWQREWLGGRKMKVRTRTVWRKGPTKNRVTQPMPDDWRERAKIIRQVGLTPKGAFKPRRPVPATPIEEIVRLYRGAAKRIGLEAR